MSLNNTINNGYCNFTSTCKFFHTWAFRAHAQFARSSSGGGKESSAGGSASSTGISLAFGSKADKPAGSITNVIHGGVTRTVLSSAQLVLPKKV